MTDRLDIPVETTEGWRPDPSRGERVMVALAALALLGGALIIGGNVLRGDDGVSLASGSPGETTSATPTPLPTPIVTPSPRELTLVEQSPPSPASFPSLFGGWIRATVDLPIYSDADKNAAVVGTLPAGALAYADEQSQGTPELGWLTIEAPQPTGWVATRAGNKDLAKRYLPADVAVSGWVWNVAAGPSGFVAIGNSSGRSSSFPGQSLFVSTDGVAWRAASVTPGPDSYPAGVAWGPAGWLMVTGDPDSGRSRLWSSPDGDRWRSTGVLETDYPQGLAASGEGYLLQTSGRGYGSGGESWFSADGIHWTESKPGLTGSYQVTATAAGFYARTLPEWPTPASQSTAAFSTGGVTWAPLKPTLFVGAAGGALLGIDPGPDGRGGYPVRGSFFRGRLAWRPIEGGDAPFAGAVVTSLVSDGQQATAFGWDATTEASLTWTSDGGPWTRHRLPSAFGGPPLLAAAGGNGTVAVGNRWSSRGPNPVFWHQGADGSWEPELSPVLGVAADPSADECGAPPIGAVEFINLDRSFAAACWGDAPMTVRLWSSACDGCAGEVTGSYEEEWLANPTSNLLYVSPVKWPDTWWATVVLAPELGVRDPGWAGSWLELTGHFDDPAASRCHWTPPPDQLASYGGTRQLVEACRQQFVVTEVRVVDGP